MKNSLILLFLLISIPGITQVSGTIYNIETREPVPYANISIENTLTGTTSDSNGRFHFSKLQPDKRLVISSVGFEKQYYSASDSVIEIFLQPKTYEIGLISVKPVKNPKRILVHEIPGLSCSNYLVCSGYPWMSARFFDYVPEYKNCSKIIEIKVLTLSKIPGSKFNVRIISANEIGEPGEDIISENIIAATKKGNYIKTINLEKFNLSFPSGGLFVAVEWLIIEENRYNYIFQMKGEKKKRNETRYDPEFGAFPGKGTIMTWSYGGGKWVQNSFQGKSNHGGYLDIAIELVLSE